MPFQALGKNFRHILHFLPILLFGVALFIVHHEIQSHRLTDIAGVVKSVPVLILLAAAGLTLINYLVLGGYDVLALRYTGHKVPLPKIALASLIGYAISNNTGHAWASGGSVRYRFYTAWGVPGWDVVKISLFLGTTYLLGVLTLGLVGILMLPADLRGNIENPQIINGMGVVCLVSLAGYWLMVLFWRKPLTIRNTEVRLPSPLLTLAQTVISGIDLVLASIILWLLLPDSVSFGFETFLVIFVIAQVAGLHSQVPGGLGVFESAFLWLLPSGGDPAQHLAIVGALVLYRIVYYFLPLGLAGIGLVAFELYERRSFLRKTGEALGQSFSSFVPQVFSVLLLFNGAILLVSGATPSVPEHMKWLRDFIPLSVVEVSHLIGSLTGLLLLFLARGIRLRLDAAWYGSIILLTVGVISSLLKGLDWQEASILLILLLLMVPAKDYFRRKSSLFNMSFSAPWIGMTLIVLAGTTWLGFFAYRHVDYADELWWQFSYKDDAPRFLRALLVMTVTVTAFAAYRLFTVVRPKTLTLPGQEELEIAAALAAQEQDSRGFLALCGDKHLLWSESRDAFIMFAATGKYWIAMGDPVGKRDSFEALLWRFREVADHFGAKAVFYEVGEANLPLYLDLGLVLLKLGEEARLSLPDFSMEGKRRDNLRNARNKFGKQHYRFSVLEREQVTAALPRLSEISDLWLVRKNAHEKGFSLGFFDPDYLCHTRVAVALAPDGKIMAFANLWETENREELSIDLMRYDPAAPGGIMDYLFGELMLWGQSQGFKWFSLGMAPLSGLERHPLAPLWHKIGTAIFDLGEEFYNFEGLYEYKAKFDPVWLPRYLAAPAGLSVPLILMTVSRLIARGWRRPRSRSGRPSD